MTFLSNVRSSRELSLTTITALICGESGSGKTHQAGTLKGKTLVVSCESGELTLRKFDVDFIEVKNLNDLRSILIEAQSSDYDNIYIDSISEVAEWFLEEAKQKYPDDSQTLKMFGYNKESMKKFIRFIRDIKKNVFIASLLKVQTDNLQRRFMLPDIAGSMASMLPQFFDFVFCLRVITKEDEMQRAIQTKSVDGYVCKSRIGNLNMYEEADLGKLIEKITGEK